MTVRPKYVNLNLTEQQIDLLRRLLDDAATGYKESNPRTQLLRKVEKTQREQWPDAA
jgi:hypothetical protein